MKRYDCNEVSFDVWDAIPDVGDHSLKMKQGKRRADMYTPMPDSVLASGGAGETGSIAAR